MLHYWQTRHLLQYPTQARLMEAREHTQANLSLLREKRGSGRVQSAQMLIGSLHPSEVARLLESLPQTERFLMWEMVDPDIGGEVLV